MTHACLHKSSVTDSVSALQGHDASDAVFQAQVRSVVVTGIFTGVRFEEIMNTFARKDGTLVPITSYGLEGCARISAGQDSDGRPIELPLCQVTAEFASSEHAPDLNEWLKNPRAVINISLQHIKPKQKKTQKGRLAQKVTYKNGRARSFVLNIPRLDAMGILSPQRSIMVAIGHRHCLKRPGRPGHACDANVHGRAGRPRVPHRAAECHAG